MNESDHDVGCHWPELPPNSVLSAKRQSSQKALILQQYLDWHNQSESQSPRQRRSSSSSDDLNSIDAVNAPSSPTIMTSASPTHYSSHRNTTFGRTYNMHPCGNNSQSRRGSSRSSSIAPIPENDVLESSPSDYSSSAIDHDDRASYDEQNDLKSTLMDLLNCDTVRHDDRMRAWVQSRLMEAEHELKRHRRRRIGRSVSVSSETSSCEGGNAASPS